ncbi:PAC2 family protein [Rothia nasisuis]|uniref:PAC2 family protein n=1 Tax=Rothia nasisuis TaxID=2109647 RepID=UPI001F29D0BA|nr:PAC2 family protein [Rothia nasisuis]
MNQPLPLDALQHFAQLNAPPERAPTLLLVGLEGWNDAGGAVQDALTAVQDYLHSQPRESFASSAYYDYTVTRPHLSTDEDGSPTVTWPQFTLTEGISTAGRRVLTLTGPEPSLNWHELTSNVVDLVQHEQVDLVILCGSLLDEIPHTLAFPVSVTSWAPAALELDGVAQSTYTGPTGLIGVLAQALGEQGVPSLSLWVSVPYYLPEPPHPKGSFALLSTLEAVCGIPLPLHIFSDRIMGWERTAADLLDDEPELSSFVRTLESAAEARDDLDGLGQVDIAAEFERFLRGRDGGEPGQAPGEPS